MGTTVNYALRYPELTDVADGPAGFRNLAQDTDATIRKQTSKSFASYTDAGWSWINLNQSYTGALLNFTITEASICQIDALTYFKAWQGVVSDVEIAVKHETLGLLVFGRANLRNDHGADTYPTVTAYRTLQLQPGNHRIELNVKCFASNITPSQQHWGSRLAAVLTPGNYTESSSALRVPPF